MGKRYKDLGCICPHYHSEDAQHIYCDGIEQDNWIHMAWASKAQKKEYKYTFCRCEWKECPIAGLHKK